MTWRTWRTAMSDALYGEGGFYCSSGAPGRHFRTAAHGGAAWAAAIAELAQRIDDAAGNPADFTIVDVGAGGGELLQALATIAPARWQLVGVDVAPPPVDLQPRVHWQTDAPGAVTGLVLAVELLDVVPVDVVEVAADALRLVEVDDTGAERLGAVASADDAAWVQSWTSLMSVGDRAEVGAPRDAMWHSLREGVARGAAVVIDYETAPQWERTGTLTGYRDGQQIAPVPDGSCDITAHVCFNSLRTTDDVVLRQDAALRQLGVTPALPEYDGNASGYLTALSAIATQQRLLDPAGLGGFTWLVHPVRIASPLSADAADPGRARLRSKPGRRTSARTSSRPR
jgi:SAM-dependent MidA family methyltransferase